MDHPTTRRHVLTLLGAAGLATTLGACSPSKKASNSNGEFHGAWPYELPPKGHFNLINGVTHGILGDNTAIYKDLVLTSMAMLHWKEKRWEYLLAESHNVDKQANTITVKLRSGLKWSDGKALTAEDVVATYWVLKLMRQVEVDLLEKWEAKDERTVVFTMKKPSTLAERYILRSRVVSRTTYGEWATKTQALFTAGKDLTGEEGKKLNTDFQAFRPTEVVASGPYNFDYKSVTQAQFSLVRNANGFNADKVRFQKVVVFNGETPEVTPVVMAKNVDYATHGFPPAADQGFGQSNIRVLRPPVYSGPALLFNLDKQPEFKDKRVRQAIAHAIDRDQNGTVTLGKSGKGVKLMAGFSDNQVPEWLSEDDRKKLNKYEFNQQKAADLLTAAGWKKVGDRWNKPDGKPAEYEVIFHAEFADYSACGSNVAEQLTKFGIKVVGRGVTHTQQPVDVDKGAFQLAIQIWGAQAHPHPQFAFHNDLFLHNIPVAANRGGRGMGFEMKQTTDVVGEVDLQKAVLEAGQGLDEAAQKKNVTTVALAFNELLPMLPLFERYGNNPALEGTRVKKFPADDDPILQNAPYGDNFVVMSILTGKLEPA